MDLQSSNSQEMNTNLSQNGEATAIVDDNKPPRPQPDHAEKCPRCDSGNTKFCYYNNYSLSQPRYFCKGCRRYWTKGGTLRNVPVGGGCRKNKRSAKRALDSHHHLLVQSHLVENNSNNVLLRSASFDPNNVRSLGLADHSNFSSPLRYDEDSRTCDNLSLAFGTLQKQCNVQVDLQHHLGFGFDPQNSILGHQPIRTNTNNVGFLSNFFEPQTTSFNYSQNLFNYGFENVGIGAQRQSDHHTEPLLLPNENLTLSNMTEHGFNEMKHEMNGELNSSNKMIWRQVESDNIGVGEGSLTIEKNNNLVLETGSNKYDYNDGYEVEGGGRSERWNNTGLASASCWPNLINSALIM